MGTVCLRRELGDLIADELEMLGPDSGSIHLEISLVGDDLMAFDIRPTLDRANREDRGDLDAGQI